MSFNPFSKKNPASAAAAEGVDAAADVDSGAGLQTRETSADLKVRPTEGPPHYESDRTDPLADAHVAPAAKLLREGPGGRVEAVQLGEDSFLRLTVGDSQRADRLRPLLLDLPESATGFRDLLVADDSALAAAFDLPETSLAALGGDYRPLDILNALTSTANLLAAAANAGLVWPKPSAELVGLMSEQPHRAAGYRRWRAIFTGWDQLAAGDEAQAARQLTALCIPPLDALLNRSQEAGFRPAHLPLAQLLGRLEQLAQSAESYAQLAALDFAAGMPRLHAMTDTGRRREHNEDAYALLSLEQASVAGSRFALAAVADGMGGHNSGEIASSLALDLLRTQLGQLALSPKISWERAGTGPAPTVLVNTVEQIIPAIGRALNERAAMDSQLGGMGTTLAGYAMLAPQTTHKDSLVPPPQGAVFWVGDSRAYLLCPAGLLPLSVDHSYVQSLVDQGQVSSEEAFSHPQKNIITRCLGGSGQDDRPEVAPFALGPGELLLLCSDGLTDALRERDVWRVACEVESGELAEIAAALVDAANAAGGPDNITVALVAPGALP